MWAAPPLNIYVLAFYMTVYDTRVPADLNHNTIWRHRTGYLIMYANNENKNRTKLPNSKILYACVSHTHSDKGALYIP